MKILSIETSCDETAISLLEAEGGFENPKFSVLGNTLHSQIDIHKEYGGVYPTLAKREHGRNLVPLLLEVMERGFGISKSEFLNPNQILKNKRQNEIQRHSNILQNVRMVLEREPDLLEQFARIVPRIKRPDIDYIAVTQGPGLEPALWVGINFAKALSIFWDIPIIPVNHMEGHIFSVLWNGEEISNDKFQMTNSPDEENIAIQELHQEIGQAPVKWQKTIKFPAIALLISGGHTELVLVKDYGDYEIVGQTQDDAVGEAFDKVGRMLGLPYPGGPEISRLAKQSRNKSKNLNSKSQIPTFAVGIPTLFRGVGTSQKSEIRNIKLPRPMIKSGDCNFSFSGLKTAVLYRLKDLDITEDVKKEFAREFEDAIVEVLTEKTKKAIHKYGAKNLIVGGGVIANTEIRKAMLGLGGEIDIPVLIPSPELSTDNAIMIAIAGYFNALKNPGGVDLEKIKAKGNLSL